MHASGLRALTTGCFVAIPKRPICAPCRHQRGFQSTARLRKRADEDDADKSASLDDSHASPPPASPEDTTPNSQSSTETVSRRNRQPWGMTPRTRARRRRPVDALPPVKLEQSFLEHNVLLYEDGNQEEGLKKFSISHRWPIPTQSVRASLASLELLMQKYENATDTNVAKIFKVFEKAFDAACWNESLVEQALKDGIDHVEGRGEMVLDLAYIMASFLKLRPSPDEFSRWATCCREPAQYLSSALEESTEHPEKYQLTINSIVSDCISRKNQPQRHLTWFDSKSYVEVTSRLGAELALDPPSRIPKRNEIKRPVTLVTIPNYNGKCFSKAMAAAVAWSQGADVVSIDAQTLSALVGGYLGQDLAYSRGPVSTLGYSIAELNGRLGKASEPPPRAAIDAMSVDEDDSDHTIRASIVDGSRSPLEREIQKIKENLDDYVLPSLDRWESLKIKAVLETIMDAASIKSSAKVGPNSSPRKLIIHVDDFVELSMSIEGFLLLSRLRSIADKMWQNGTRLVILGTSAYENPSEQYATALAEICAEESHFACPVDFSFMSGMDASKPTMTGLKSFLGDSGIDYTTPEYSSDDLRKKVQEAVKPRKMKSAAEVRSMVMANDNEDENLKNVRQMLRHLAPDIMDRVSFDFMPDKHAPFRSVLPLPVVYDVAKMVIHETRKTYADVPTQVPARQLIREIILRRYGQEEAPKSTLESSHNQTDGPKSDDRKAPTEPRYNDHEKKLLPGLIHADSMRTTFADIHIDPAVVSNIKLLTSLSLLRPDALTYGILAKERSPGLLLYGPPGTGKTLLAKAVAKESGANFLEVTAASINNMYVGESEKNVRAIFSLAKKLAPMVVFIDEADALLGSRVSRRNDSFRGTLTQMLHAWDGLKETSAFVMAATNRPYDLDEAALRRLPRKILVDLPLLPDRLAILEIHLKGETIDDSVVLKDIATKTQFYSGSDLKNLCVAAAMSAVQEENQLAAAHTGSEPYQYAPKRVLRQDHFDRAFKEVGATVSDDSGSMKAIKKFDETYGKPYGNTKKVKSLGFGALPTPSDSDVARVRPVA